MLWGLPNLRHLERGDFLADVIEDLEEKAIMANNENVKNSKSIKRIPSLKVFTSNFEYISMTSDLELKGIWRTWHDILQVLPTKSCDDSIFCWYNFDWCNEAGKNLQNLIPKIRIFLFLEVKNKSNQNLTNEIMLFLTEQAWSHGGLQTRELGQRK